MEQSNTNSVSTKNDGNTEGAVCCNIKPQATDSQNASSSGVNLLNLLFFNKKQGKTKKQKRKSCSNRLYRKQIRADSRKMGKHPVPWKQPGNDNIPKWDSSSGKPRVLSNAEIKDLHIAFTRSIERIRAGVVSDFSEVPRKPNGVTYVFWTCFIRRYGLYYQKKQYSFKNLKKEKNKIVEDAIRVDPKNLLLPLNLPTRNSKSIKLGLKKPRGSDPDPLWFVIFAPEAYPDKILSIQEIDKVYNLLLSLLPQKFNVTSQIMRSKNASGSLLVLCDCEITRDWACKQLKEINKIGCFSLRFLHSNELPNTIRMVSTFEGPFFVKKEIIAKLLMAQNSSLDTTNWQFYQVRDNCYIVDMDIVSAEVISKWRYSLFYGFGKIKMSVSEEGIIRREISEMNPKELEALHNNVTLEKQGGSPVFDAGSFYVSDDEEDSEDDDN